MGLEFARASHHCQPGVPDRCRCLHCPQGRRQGTVLLRDPARQVDRCHARLPLRLRRLRDRSGASCRDVRHRAGEWQSGRHTPGAGGTGGYGDRHRVLPEMLSRGTARGEGGVAGRGNAGPDLQVPGAASTGCTDLDGAGGRPGVPVPHSGTARATMSSDRSLAVNIPEDGAHAAARERRWQPRLAGRIMLRTFPVVAALLLLTQGVLAWIDYRERADQLETRASMIAELTSEALARPLWMLDRSIYVAQAQAVAQDPAFLFGRIIDVKGEELLTIGDPPTESSFTVVREIV